MIGSYEQVPSFRLRRRKVFEVVDKGIVFRERLYGWAEIRDMSAVKGIGFIVFTDGTRCRIHMNSFRRQGEPGHISLVGDNPTFRQLAGYWYKKKLEALKDPKLGILEAEINELLERLDAANEGKEVSRIERRLKQATSEYSAKQQEYTRALEAEFKKLRRKHHINMVLIGLSFLIMAIAILWDP